MQPRLTLPLALSSLPIKKVKVKSLSRVRLSVTPWTAAFEVPPSMGFSRQGYWSGVPFLSLPINIFVFLLCSEKASQTQFSPEAFALMPSGPSRPNFPKRGLSTRCLHLLPFPPLPSGAFLPLFCSDYSVSSVTQRGTQRHKHSIKQPAIQRPLPVPISPYSLSCPQTTDKGEQASIPEKLGFRDFGATPLPRVPYHGSDHSSSISFSSTWLLNLDILSAYLSCSPE